MSLNFDAEDFDLEEESSEEESNSFDDFDAFGDSSSDDEDVSENDEDSDSDSDEFNNFEVENKEKDGKGLAVKIIVAGVIGLFVILILARIFLGHKSANNEADVSSNKEWTQSSTIVEENTDTDKNESAKEILNNSESSSYSNSDYDSGYTEITGEDDIELNDSLSDLTFTITDIKHYAKSDETTLRVKTVLKGAISGYTGTYELEVPYSKGIKLSIGDSFNVKCRLGSYNGKNVIEEISY